MPRVLPTVNLTNHQKMLLAMIAAAPPSPSGGKRVHLDDDKLVSAQNLLVKLGIITYDSQTQLVDLTDKATTLMQEDGITDETGQLTDTGKQYAKGETPDTKDNSEETSPEQQIPSTERFHVSFTDFLILTEG